MDIIQTELRLKDIEWMDKHLKGLKQSGRALNNTSLADKAKKEEIASSFDLASWASYIFDALQATVEKVLKCLTEDNKDVRKGEWTNKEVNFSASGIDSSTNGTLQVNLLSIIQFVWWDRASLLD